MPHNRETQNTPVIAANDAAIRSTLAVGLLGIALVHVIDGIGKYTEVPYMFWMYVGLIISSLALAGGLLFTRSKWVLPATVGLVASALIGFILSRTTGLPNATDDIGNWGETIGVVNLFVEITTLMVAVPAMALAGRVRSDVRVRRGAESAPLSA